MKKNQNIKIICDGYDNKELFSIGKYKFVVNPLEQIPYTSAKFLRSSCEELAKRIPSNTTKIITEEDKGAVLVAGISLLTNLPFGLARWYPNELVEQMSEKLNMEYLKGGNLYLNGVLPGDKVVIVEDMVSTGGTLIALIKAIKKAGGFVIKAISLAEKINYGGREKIKKETGYNIESLIRIDVSGKKSKILL